MIPPAIASRTTSSYGPACIAYAATLVVGVIWGLRPCSMCASWPWSAALRPLLLAPLYGVWPAALLVAALLVSLKARRTWYGIAFGCSAIAAWLFLGCLFRHMHT